jgi:hypothetical protein
MTTTTRSRRIWQIGSSVYLRTEDEYGEAMVREFWVPEGGGYVREISTNRPGTLGLQVCEWLAHSGNTLTSSRDGLLALIRAEYRRAVAATQREQARW